MDKIQEFSLILMGILILIIIYASVGSLFQHKHIHFIHQTGLGIIIGFLFGLGLYLFGDISDIQFNEEVFFYGLLPPMIFAGGYNLKKRKFGQNIKYIILFGLLGTLVSFGVIFGLTYLINQLGWIINLGDGATITLTLGLIIKFSATICATDSVAALTLISPKKFPKLFSIIFGEGMVNDAVAIILFKVVGAIFDDLQPAPHSSNDGTGTIILNILVKFLETVIFSLLIGIFTSLLCSFLFRKFRFLVKNPVIEVVMVYLFGLLSYVIAQIFDMSGVITVLVSGVTLAHYNFYNLSITGQLCTGVTFQFISFLAEAIVFIYLGVSTIYYYTQEEISLSFLGLEVVICIISRATAILGLSFLVKLCNKSSWKVYLNELIIITIAGTIRGSVAFALILTIENQHHDPAISIIKSTTLIMVFLTTIVLGALMPWIIKKCLGEEPQHKTKEITLESITEALKQDQEGDQDQEQQEKKEKENKKPGFFKNADENHWKPFFIWNYFERKPQIQEFKKMLKLNSNEYKGGQYAALMIVGARGSVMNNFVNKDNKRFNKKGKESQITNTLIQQTQEEHNF